MAKSIIAHETGGTIFLPPEDTHIARCILLADIGTQPADRYGAKRQIIIGFELPGCMHVFDEERGEEPAMLSRFFTLSLNEKANLREFLEGWRSRAFTSDELAAFDLINLLGVPVLISVKHQENQAGNKRAVIASASKVPTGMEVPEQVLPLRSFAFSEPSTIDFDSMPGFVQERIRNSEEYTAWMQELSGGEQVAAVTEDDGDEIPF